MFYNQDTRRKLNGLGEPITAATLITIAGSIGKVLGKISGAISNIFGGAYSDRPLIRTRDSITDLFKKYGYSMLDANGKSIMEKYGLKQAQIDDRSKSIDYYVAKFAKLYEYVIAVLSDNGRSDLVLRFVENTPLYVPGGTKSIPYLEQLLSTNPPGKLVNPPGSQIPKIPDGAIKPPGNVTTESGQTFTLPTNQVSNAYKIIKDAQGNITQIYDAVTGRLISPGTPEYNAAVNTQPAQAGTGLVLGGIALFLAALAWVAGRGGNKKKQAA